MHAVILDIDGTLLNSSDVDGTLYLAAIRKVLGPAEVRSNWGLYQNVTDRGILEEILDDNSLPKRIATLTAVRDIFVESIGQHIDRYGPFAEIPGARAFVSSLRSSDSHCVAYATGGWSASASIKLKSAGFPLDGIPLASSDDYPERPAIMTRALEQLGGDFQSVTYYGDGEWDAAASRSLGWKFVPVGEKMGGLSRFEAVGAVQPMRPTVPAAIG